MAARIRKIEIDSTHRERIQTTQLLKRLTDHGLGNVEMSATQVTAALGVLRKSLPDLQATELSGQVAHPTVIRAPDQPATSKAWQDRYAPGIEPVEQPPKPSDVN